MGSKSSSPPARVGMMPISSGAKISSQIGWPMRRWCSAQPMRAPTATPVGMMTPKVPVKVKVEVGPANCCMNPRRLAAQASPSTAPSEMRRMRPMFRLLAVRRPAQLAMTTSPH
jgi:hypothetical protein